MKIVIVTPSKNPFGGVGVMDRHLEKCLISLGHQVHYLTAESGKQSLATKVFGLPWITAKRFKSISQDYDLVICNGEFGLFISHPRCICLFHGSYYGLSSSLKKFHTVKNKLANRWLSFIQVLASRGKRVITVSEFTKEILCKQGIDCRTIIINPVDLELFEFAPSLKTNGKAIFVGQNAYYAKGFDRLERISKEVLPVDCVTSGMVSSDLNHLLNVNNTDLPGLLPYYDLMIHPSRFEASSLVVLEALACGLPVLMNRVGVAQDAEKVIPEMVIDFETSTLGEIDDRISFIRSNRSELSERGRQFVEMNHSLSQYNDSWATLISEVMA